MEGPQKYSRKDLLAKILELPEELRDVAIAKAAAAYPVRCDFLREFVPEAWRIINPGVPFLEGWVHGALAEHLVALVDGQIKRLLINMPPRHGKSLFFSVFLPAWMWTFRPAFRWVYTSYRQSLATRDSRRSRQIIESNWYQENFGHVFQLTSDQNEKMRYDNNRTGWRLSGSVGLTGDGGDAFMIDDPHDIAKRESEPDRELKLDYFNEIWPNRLDDQRTGVMGMVGHRVHEDDVSARAIEVGWTHLCLPFEYEASRRCVTVPLAGKSDPWGDPRTDEGEILHPERFDDEAITRLKRTHIHSWSGLFQQDPIPADGDIFKREWFQYWHPDGKDGMEEPPEEFDIMCISFDCSFTESDSSDFTVGQLWGRKGATFWLLDQVRKKVDYTDAEEMLVKFCSRYPEVTAKLVEKAASGFAIVSRLKKRLPGAMGIPPKGSKVARAYAVTPLWQAMQVYIPHPDIEPWVPVFVKEHLGFDQTKHDDQVDAGTQALRWLEKQTRLDAF